MKCGKNLPKLKYSQTTEYLVFKTSDYWMNIEYLRIRENDKNDGTYISFLQFITNVELEQWRHHLEERAGSIIELQS